MSGRVAISNGIGERAQHMVWCGIQFYLEGFVKMNVDMISGIELFGASAHIVILWDVF